MAKLTDSAPSGMLDDIDITIIKARTGNNVPYPNSDKVCDCALILDVSTDDGQVHQQILSAGKSVQASNDGFTFTNTPKDNSKAKIFIMSLVGLKYPGIEEDVRIFEGLVIHVKNIKYESNIKRNQGEADPTAWVATAIVSLPKQKGRPTTAKPAAVATPSSSARPAPVSNGDVDEQAREQVLIALSANEGTLTRQRLGTVVMTEVAKLKTERPEVFRNLMAIRKSVTDATWLAAQAEAGGWVSEGDKVSLA